MVLQPNAKDIIANGAVSYIINELQTALRDFHEECAQCPPTIR